MTSVEFASLLAYTPYSRDPGGDGRKAREAKGMVKGARPTAMRRVASLCEERVDTDFCGFFRRDCTLIPVPPARRQGRTTRCGPDWLSPKRSSSHGDHALAETGWGSREP